MAVNRQHPFFSGIGCLGGLGLIVGIVAAVLMSGGAIFSPGALTAWAANETPLKGFRSHADFENDCRQCHEPFQGISPERCEACHMDVGTERSSGDGLHGQIPPEQAARCERCHLDHQGRDLDPNTHALKKFDHAVVGFSLARHITRYDGSPLECQGCHHPPDYALDPARCADCHGEHDASLMSSHLRAFGQACGTCHDGVDQTANFDHAQVDFPLAGRHADVSCESCHTASVAAQATPTDCSACHVEPPVHAGFFDADCAVCHTAAGWSPARLDGAAAFRHADTGFQLINHTQEYDGALFTCRTCHTDGKLTFAVQTCGECHGAHDLAFVTEHLQAYGPNCLSCHDGAGNMRDFDHNRLFAPDGRHAPLECTACHADQEYRGTPRDCAACHVEPEVHAGLFGTDCAACHMAAAWTPALLTQHAFPLDHGEEGEIACATCHTHSYVAYTCYGCHEHDPAIVQEKHAKENVSASELPNCAECHPAGGGEEGGH